MPLTVAILAAQNLGHPTLPGDATWAGVLIIVILTLLLAAMIIGPIIRLNTPDRMPDTHAHDELDTPRH